MRKIFLLGLICSFSFSSFAAVLSEEEEKPAEAHTKDVNADAKHNKSKLEMEIRLDFVAGTRGQKHLTGSDRFLTAEKKALFFDNGAAVKVIYSNEMEEFNYGGVVVLTPTAQISTSSSFNGSHIYFSTDYGIVKLGSPGDAGSELRITGDYKTVDTYWSSLINLTPKYSQYHKIGPEFERGNKWYNSSYKLNESQIIDGTEFSRKVSFLTPEIDQGIRFGVSYTPDSRNIGSSDFSNKSLKTGIVKHKIDETKNTMVINENIRDAFSFGLRGKHNFDEVTILELAATFEIGKAIGKAKLIENEGKHNSKVLETYKISNLRAYNIGGIFDIGNFSYALSYGILNKSLTTSAYNKTGRNTIYYNGGIVYQQGPIKSSIEYFKSNKFKNTLDVVTLGSEYKLAPGLMPYASFSYLISSGRPSFYPEAPKKKIRASSFVMGLKLRVKL